MNYPLVFDYSTGPPSASSLKAQGIGVMRYLPRYGGDLGIASITAPEYTNLNDYGVLVGLVCEQHSPRRPIESGYDGGKFDAQWFGDQCIKLGLPIHSLYAAYDYNDTGQYAITRSLEYATGWKEVLGSAADAYGFMGTLQALHSHNLFGRSWLAGAQPNVFPDFVNLYQWNNGNTSIDGITCDINYVIKDDWGQINAIGLQDMSLSSKFEVDPTKGRAYASFEVGSNSMIIKELWVGAKALWGNIPNAKLTFVDDNGNALTQEPINLTSNRRMVRRVPDGASDVTIEWDATKADGVLAPYLVWK